MVNQGEFATCFYFALLTIYFTGIVSRKSLRQVRRKKAKKGSKGGEWDDPSSEAALGGVGMAGQRALVHSEGAGRRIWGKKGAQIRQSVDLTLIRC